MTLEKYENWELFEVFDEWQMGLVASEIRVTPVIYILVYEGKFLESTRVFSRG
jgi:hypothetical protein